jgi:hypothetical protein
MARDQTATPPTSSKKRGIISWTFNIPHHLFGVSSSFVCGWVQVQGCFSLSASYQIFAFAANLSLRDFFEREPFPSRLFCWEENNGKKNYAFVSGNLRKLIKHFAV